MRSHLLIKQHSQKEQTEEGTTLMEKLKLHVRGEQGREATTYQRRSTSAQIPSKEQDC